ncbi:transmembrane protein 231-like [Diorhabda carinulata]|uniref:transmembrane protein 231-like n=1 Tax=Diorhabda carinulata TaxID=1163345 RepID=UPI0025A1A41B|nr:transmembrane protein 231-like [Diorhabda carinulata]
MVVLEVFTKSIKIKYKSTLVSKATFVALIIWSLRIILPFLIAYKTGGLWLKSDKHFEQPEINILGDYILIGEAYNAEKPIICSTYGFYKKYLIDLDRCSSIKLREIDRNFDKKPDELELEINVIVDMYKLSSIHIVLPIKYELNMLCPLKMQSLIYFQYYFQQEKVTELKIFANLKLFQNSVFMCTKQFAEYYDRPIIEDQYESKHFLIENIVERYNDRNVSTHLTNIYTFIKKENLQTFKLKLNVKYPEDSIYYRPGFWQVLKIAWVQYIAIYLVIAWLFQRFNLYIFRHRLVWYYEENPLKIKTI